MCMGQNARLWYECVNIAYFGNFVCVVISYIYLQTWRLSKSRRSSVEFRLKPDLSIQNNMTISAWFMDNEEGDQRLPHRLPGDSSVSMDHLAKLGVLHWSGISCAEDPRLAEIMKERGYTYTDVCNIAPGSLPDFENKIKSFFREHIHYDEEIRLCLEGSGYFDVRGLNDEWIRISLEAGDMIILPEGIYHRFTCDEKDHIKAMRLFVGEPVWTPYNRDEIDEMKNASRLKYVQTFMQ